MFRPPFFWACAVAALCVSGGLACRGGRPGGGFPPAVRSGAGPAARANQVLRDRVAGLVRRVAEAGEDARAGPDLSLAGDWAPSVAVWYGGQKRGEHAAQGRDLGRALCQATVSALAEARLGLEAVREARFQITLDRLDCAILEHHGRGVELIDGLVAVRRVDRRLVEQHVARAKAYLLGVLDPVHGGAHKYYYPASDRFEDRLHTIYTASLVFTLLKLRDADRDERLASAIRDASAFLLSMQNADAKSRTYGAFHYAYFTEEDRKQPRFVVGTTAKTIFTLLVLHARTGDARYLDAAARGADWLVTMLRPDGSVRPYVRQREDGTWSRSQKESMLYNGQVLSALSRIHAHTGRRAYRAAADRLAARFVQKFKSDGCYVGDDYRKPNPISTSWMALSLLDYAKAFGDDYSRALALLLSRNLLGRQIHAPDDPARHGRWERAFSSSGNGWLAEVMSEFYLYGRAEGLEDCERYKASIVRVSRWILQHALTGPNAYDAANPDRAQGGFLWSARKRYVRTDSVCHGANAWINIVGHLEEGPLLVLPERLLQVPADDE